MAIEKTEELGLVKTRVDKGKYPPRNLITVTEKGKVVSDKIKEMLKILSSIFSLSE